MDSRDFTSTALPEVRDGEYLEKIYDLQMELIQDYYKIEKTVLPPVNINTKSSQVLLKDFSARVIEELAECHESLHMLGDIVEETLNLTQADESQCRQVMNHLQNAGEEMADALHFMTELLIYANVQPADIADYLKKDDNKSQLQLFKDDIIEMAMVVGAAGFRSKYQYQSSRTDLHNFLDLTQYNPDDSLDFTLLKCGHLYNKIFYNQVSQLFWDVTYNLNVARNFLKNKPWKQSEELSYAVGYQENLVKAFISLMGVFYELGMNSSEVFVLYFRKNCVNKFRIKSKY